MEKNQDEIKGWRGSRAGLAVKGLGVSVPCPAQLGLVDGGKGRVGAQEEVLPTPSFPAKEIAGKQSPGSPTGLKEGREPGNQKPGLGPRCVTPESWGGWLRS